jgi:hypothetical protein
MSSCRLPVVGSRLSEQACLKDISRFWGTTDFETHLSFFAIGEEFNLPFRNSRQPILKHRPQSQPLFFAFCEDSPGPVW